MKRYKVHLVLGPLLAILTWTLADLQPGNDQVTIMAGIALWMAWWWLSEAVPLAVTALLPLVLFPVFGVLPAKDISDEIESVAGKYMDSIIFLFVGGFILAFAIERWNLHKRIALRILMAVGTRPSRILFGVMLTTYILSMWISNTATVLMLLSAVLAVLYQVESHMDDEKQKRRFATALLIGLAYAASIGGMASLVGTPTNMIFYSKWQNSFPGSNDINFVSWMKVGVPVSLMLLVFTWALLRFLFIRRMQVAPIGKDYFRNALVKLGPMSYEEKMVLGVFIQTALLWFTRSPIDFGAFEFPGWASLFGKYAVYVDDSTVAIFAAILLFLIPSRNEKGRSLIMWKEAEKLPFDIILLFGGGLALAEGFGVTGLSSWIAGHLDGLKGLPYPLMIGGMCVLIAFISEFASNVASISLMLPALMALYEPLGLSPLALLVPATLASSLGFMLPVATAPNTIVFGTKRIRTAEMYRAGIWVDLAGVVLITLISMLFF